MDSRIGELRYKEVINVTDGTRYGYVEMWRWTWRPARSAPW